MLVAVLALSYEVYNPASYFPGCSFNVYPANCHLAEDDDIECLRGENYALFWVFAFVLALTTNLIIQAANLFIVVRTLRILNQVPSLSEFLSTSREERVISQNMQSKTRRVAEQCILFVVPFNLCYISSWILLVVDFIDPEGNRDGRYYGLKLTVTIFLPLQGFFNAIVFLRPDRDLQNWFAKHWDRKSQCTRARLAKSASSSTTGNKNIVHNGKVHKPLTGDESQDPTSTMLLTPCKEKIVCSSHEESEVNPGTRNSQNHRPIISDITVSIGYVYSLYTIVECKPAT